MKLMKMLGFEDDEYDEYDESEEPQKFTKRSGAGLKQSQRVPAKAATQIVFYKGVPSESTKLKLRDALLDGIMVLLDLHDLSPREFDEKGSPFINFMGGVAFAHRGRMEQISQDQAMYLVTPYEGMFEEWIEEGID